MIEKKEYLITDMMCNNCVMHLEAIENELPGITRAEAVLVKRILKVEYDNEKLLEQDIQAAIKSKGYTVG